MKNASKESRFTIGGFVALLIMGLMIIFYFLSYFGKTVEIKGKVISFYNMQIETQDRFIVVEIDNGSVVKAWCPENFVYIKDANVLLLERHTPIFGRKKYEFIRYLE